MNGHRGYFAYGQTVEGANTDDNVFRNNGVITNKAVYILTAVLM